MKTDEDRMLARHGARVLRDQVLQAKGDDHV